MASKKKAVKKQVSAATAAKLSKLRSAGRKLVHKEKAKAFYFSGKKKKAKTKRKASPAQLKALAKGRAKVKANRKHTEKGSFMASRKRKKSTSKATRQVIVMGSKKRRRSRHAMAGKSTGKGSAVKNLTHNGINTASGVAGALLASFGAAKLPVANPKLKAAIPTLLGLMLTTFVKNDMVKAIGLGMSIMGGTALARSFMPSLPMLGEEQINLTDEQVRAIESQLKGAVTDFSGDNPLGSFEVSDEGNIEGEMDDDDLQGAVTDFSGSSPLGYVVANQ